MLRTARALARQAAGFGGGGGCRAGSPATTPGAPWPAAGQHEHPAVRTDCYRGRRGRPAHRTVRPAGTPGPAAGYRRVCPGP
ncbi:hypothetical protein DRQ50_04010 [bacterium]|nr:MAG: hypothetical protein DRQ50_04010 [bacterium]